MALALTSGRRVQCAVDRAALPAGVARLLARWQVGLVRVRVRVRVRIGVRGGVWAWVKGLG